MKTKVDLYVNNIKIKSKRHFIELLENEKEFKVIGNILEINKFLKKEYSFECISNSLKIIIEFRHLCVFEFISKNVYSESIKDRLNEFIFFKKTINKCNTLKYFELLYGKEIGSKQFKLFTSSRKSPYKVEYWEEKGFNKEESKNKILEYKKNKATSYVNFIKKYGEIEGQKRFDEWVDKCIHSKEKFIKKYGKEIGEIKYTECNKLKDSSSIYWAMKKSNNNFKKAKKIYDDKIKRTTIDFNHFLKKFNNDLELAKKEYEILKKKKDTGSIQHCINQAQGDVELALENYKILCSKKDNRSLKYFLKKYDGDMNLAIEDYEISKKKCAINLFYYFKKHNRDFIKAKEEYKKVLEKRYKKGSFTKASKASLKFFIPLYKFLRKNGIERNDIFLGVSGSKEKFLWDKEKTKLYFYDFTIKSKKIIFEYNGSIWHPNYEKFEDLDELEKDFKSKAYIDFNIKELVEYEKGKINTALNEGFKICIIWEEDGYEKNYNKIVNFIKENKIINNESQENSKIGNFKTYLGYRGR